jgi:hypothetical protein
MRRSELEKAMQHVKNWGRQTVGFAMKLRAKDRGTLKDTPDFLKAMVTENDSTTRELWEAALSECTKPVNPHEFMMLFTRNVLDWCTEHRKL